MKFSQICKYSIFTLFLLFLNHNAVVFQGELQCPLPASATIELRDRLAVNGDESPPTETKTK